MALKILSPDVIAVGFSERTNRAGIAQLRRVLTRREPGPRWMLVVTLPHRRAYMHLDTLITPIDRDAALLYPPVLLPGAMSQTVTLTLDPGDAEFARLPEPVALTNEVGEFSLTVEDREDGRVVISRSLTIGERRAPGGPHTGLVVGADDWPLLRALLLEESDPRSRTLMLE